MGKRIAGMVSVFLVIFCFIGPIKGGQGDEYVQSVYNGLEETEPYLSVKRLIQLAEGSTVIVGKASWYGPGFHGRTTANGEIFDENALTAAQKIAFLQSAYYQFK